MTTSYQQEKQLIIEIGRRLWLRGMVAANDGNISCRVPGGYLITRSGISKGFMSEEDILLLDSQGCPLSDGPGQPSSETAMHLGIYQSRPQTGAIVHAHPPYATAFALAEADINQAQLEELRIQLGEVAMISYAPAGTSELAQAASTAMADKRAGLLLRHGAITVGANLMEALYRIEALEQAAKIVFLSRQLAEGKPL